MAGRTACWTTDARTDGRMRECACVTPCTRVFLLGRSMAGPGGGGGTLNFFYIRRLGPSIYSSPPKNIRNFKHPKKIFEILATPKNFPILYKDLKKRP